MMLFDIKTQIKTCYLVSCELLDPHYLLKIGVEAFFEEGL